MPKPSSNIIVALDFADETAALDLVNSLTPSRCKLKIGKEMFTRFGPQFVKQVVNRGYDVFLDLKYHDIPNTVANACQAAADLGVWMLNVHASGGRAMLEAARDALKDYGAKRPRLIAVTLLTSLQPADLGDIGFSGSVTDNVIRLAKLAQASGLDGVVCSAHEAATLRTACGDDFCLVTPGIRPKTSPKSDQIRVMTPAEAIQAGADYLVIGRPITQAADPLQALSEIELDIK